MKRRGLLVLTGGTLAASAGRLRSHTADRADGPPSVDALTVELGPGEETMAIITAESVESMPIGVFAVQGEHRTAGRPVVATDEDRLTPIPTGIGDSVPPTWQWSPPGATVTHETPIRVPDSVSPSTYEHPVNVSKGSSRESEPLEVRVTA